MLVTCCTEGSCTALLVPHVRVSVKHYFVLIVSIGLSLTILKVFMMSVFRFSINSKIRGYHVYQTIWSNLYIGKELNCKREPGNSHDPHAVAMTKVISGVSTVVGHVPIDMFNIY